MKGCSMSDDGRQAVPDRRRIMRGAAAAGLVAAAIAAEQIARPAPARAGTDGDVVLGQGNTTPNITSITLSANTGLAFEADGNVNGDGVGGDSESGNGVTGNSNSGVGVAGHSHSHWGVQASSDTDTALQAQSKGGIGVVGVGTATGVYGQSGATSGFALTRDGVRGFTDSAAAAGVRGENAAGPGVSGAGHVGVLAQAKGSGATALDVQGPAAFSRSGVLTIAAGTSAVTKTSVHLTAASLVLATLQQNHAGVYLAAAVPDAAAGSFTVHLNKAAPKAVKVAWFIIN
jgi:hypothetical protein